MGFNDGPEAALIWFDGYILEYLLSVDNVFFFHVIFTSYATPPAQTYKGLYYGIIGAIMLRLIFYFVGLGIFSLAFWVQVVFGVLLIWSGYQTVVSDDEDADPKENRCVQLMTRLLPVTETYAEDGSLFIWVAAKTAGSSTAAESQVYGASATEEAPDGAEAASGGHPQRTKCRGTLLLLVILVLQVVDLMFAVDSVTAKLAESNSVYLDFTSSAFAMLCLRSMYFIMQKLLKHFRFLKYGVGLILVLIGIKLILSHWIEFPPLMTLSVIVGTFIISMVLSRVIPEKAYEGMDDDNEKDEGKTGTATGDVQIQMSSVSGSGAQSES